MRRHSSLHRADFLEQLAQFGRLGQNCEFLQHTAASPFGQKFLKPVVQ
jgi:hypothetical protein